MNSNVNLAAEKGPVIVMADEAGNVIVPSKNNPDWGHIRVAQDRAMFDERGFARYKLTNAIIPGLLKDLKKFNWKAGQELKGTIIFKESLEPFNKKEPERDYKIAGKTGIVCCYYGQPIYRKTFYNANPDARDQYCYDNEGNIITHTNVEEIRVAYRQLSESVEEFFSDKLDSI